MDKKKVKIFWPNIGGLEEYQKTLHKILATIDEKSFARPELIEWIKREFASKSFGFCRKLVDTFKAIGLLEFVHKRAALSKVAKSYLKTGDNDLIVDRMLERVVGFKEMVVVLKEHDSSPADEIRTAWEDKIKPLTFAANQYLIRLNWLRGLNYADMVARHYFLTDKGLKLFTRLRQEGVKKVKEKQEVTHNEIEDKIKIIGEFFEFEAKKRPSINDALPDYALKLRKSDRQLDCLWIRYVPFAGKIKFPIEVQLGGNIADTLDRLETVSEYVHKAIIITTEKQEEIITERLKVKKSKLLEKLIFVYVDDVYKAVEATNVLRSLTKKIFTE